MKPSIIWDKFSPKSHRLWAVAFWVVVWQLAASAVGQRILIATPADTLLRLSELVRTSDFWKSILFSLSRILSGYLLAFAAASGLAAGSRRSRWIDALSGTLLSAMRAVPVASFVIAALIWIPSRNLSVLVTFMIALPVLYSSIRAALEQVNPQLLEMAQVYRMPLLRRFRAILLPSILPAVRASALTAIGLAWKSGVAAEVIGIPSGSVGEKLYKAKVYLATPDLFAWTLVIILASKLTERLLRRGFRALEVLLRRY